MTAKRKHGGGRKKIENPAKIQVKIEEEVALNAKKNHGTYSNAIRFAAENKPENEK